MNDIANKTQEARTPFEYLSHILYIIEGFWMVITNGLIVVTLLCHRSMRKKHMDTMVALALSDGLYGIGIFAGGIRRIMLVVTRTDHLLMSSWQCLLQFPTIFYIVGSQMTALAMVLISVDRYVAVIHTLWYLRRDVRHRSRLVVLAVVVFGAAMSALAWVATYLSWGDDTRQIRWTALCLSTHAVPGWYATSYTLLVAAGGFLSVGIYVMVLVGYVKYARDTFSTDLSSSHLAAVLVKRERRITVTMAFVTLTTLLFHSIPYTIIILTTVLQLRTELVTLLNPLLWCMVCVNSLMNIFIYLKRHRDIRMAMHDVLCCQFNSRRHHSQSKLSTGSVYAIDSWVSRDLHSTRGSKQHSRSDVSYRTRHMCICL